MTTGDDIRSHVAVQALLESKIPYMSQLIDDFIDKKLSPDTAPKDAYASREEYRSGVQLAQFRSNFNRVKRAFATASGMKANDAAKEQRKTGAKKSNDSRQSNSRAENNDNEDDGDDDDWERVGRAGDISSIVNDPATFIKDMLMGKYHVVTSTENGCYPMTLPFVPEIGEDMNGTPYLKFKFWLLSGLSSNPRKYIKFRFSVDRTKFILEINWARLLSKPVLMNQFHGIAGTNYLHVGAEKTIRVLKSNNDSREQQLVSRFCVSLPFDVEPEFYTDQGHVVSENASPFDTSRGFLFLSLRMKGIRSGFYAPTVANYINELDIGDSTDEEGGGRHGYERSRHRGATSFADSSSSRNIRKSDGWFSSTTRQRFAAPPQEEQYHHSQASAVNNTSNRSLKTPYQYSNRKTYPPKNTPEEDPALGVARHPGALPDESRNGFAHYQNPSSIKKHAGKSSAAAHFVETVVDEEDEQDGYEVINKDDLMSVEEDEEDGDEEEDDEEEDEDPGEDNVATTRSSSYNTSPRRSSRKNKNVYDTPPRTYQYRVWGEKKASVKKTPEKYKKKHS